MARFRESYREIVRVAFLGCNLRNAQTSQNYLHILHVEEYRSKVRDEEPTKNASNRFKLVSFAPVKRADGGGGRKKILKKGQEKLRR